MMRFAGQAQYRRSRLNSNVRPRKKTIAMLGFAPEPQQRHEVRPGCAAAVLRLGQSWQFCWCLADSPNRAPPSKAHALLARSSTFSNSRPLGHRVAGVRPSRPGPSVGIKGTARVSTARFATSFGCVCTTVPPNARPNRSFEARPNGVALGPRGALVHHAPRGPSTTPLVPPQLER